MYYVTIYCTSSCCVLCFIWVFFCSILVH